jgi:hypothetical protein
MITFKQFLELAEASGPERGRRRLAPRAVSSGDREKTSNRAALKKAGFKRSPSGNEPAIKTTSSSDHHFTAAFTDRNQSDYAASKIQKKQRYNGKVEPTSNRVRRAKELRRQLGGDRTAKKVHDVSVFTKGDSPNKNDPKQLVSRGKSFKKEVRAVPKSLKDIGAKPGDKVAATPVAHMPGENSKSGQQKRDKIYTKELGAKMNSRTGKTMGTVKG